MFWYKAKKNKDFILGGIIILFFIVWYLSWVVYQYIIAGDFNSPFLPATNIRAELVQPFSSNYILGTDLYGRSLVEVLSSGLSYSLTLGFIVTFSATVIGIFIGYLSSTSSRFFNEALDLTTNLIFVFPSILIAIVFMSTAGSSISGLCLVLIFTGWPSYARIAKGEIKRVLGLSYVESAKAIGVSKSRLLITVIVPAILPQMIIHMVLGISGVIISESVLGFLGLGGSEYSWGALLAMGKNVLLEAPHVTIILSFVMAFLIIGMNLLGDGLRDILDPKES